MWDKTSNCTYIEHILHWGKHGDDFDNWFDMNNCQLPPLNILYVLLIISWIFPWSFLPCFHSFLMPATNAVIFSSVSVSVGTTVQHDIFSFFGNKLLSLLVSLTDFFLWSFFNLFWILISQDPLNIQNKQKMFQEFPQLCLFHSNTISFTNHT